MRLPTLLLVAACVSAHEVSATSSESSYASEVSSERVDRCATLGFDVDALDCRVCDELSTFLTSATSTNKSKLKAVNIVGQECQECCSDFSKELEAEGRRYAKVVLAVSQYRLKRYPKVANFVEHRASQIKRLEVQETNPRLPMLQFFDEQGEMIEEISVAHWDENSIAEFIDNKLLPETTEEENEVVEGEKMVMEMKAEP